MLAELLYVWAGGSVAASAGYVVGRIQGREIGREEERQLNIEVESIKAKREWEEHYLSLRGTELAEQKPHGEIGHWCTEKCYHYVRR